MPPGYLPRLIFWELTEGCNLACKHCRAGAQPERAQDELTIVEAMAVIDQIADCASPILVLTGGEPLYRPDLFEIASYAVSRGLRVAVATNGTLVDAAVAHRLKDIGVLRCSISIDGATPMVHDAFRGIAGSWQAALDGAAALVDAGVDVQFNVSVARHNMDQLGDIVSLAISRRIRALHLFLLVPVGCGLQLRGNDMLSAEETEFVLWWLSRVSKTAPLEVKATCAPQYYRIVRQHPHGDRPPMAGLTKGCLAGTHVCFISHRGIVQPCGYLPLEAGSIRQQQFADIWYESPLFSILRNPNTLQGRCGACDFKHVCAGCRARAFAETGNYLGEEPTCPYQPSSV